jgi:class 3 adenylate cyclase
MYPCPCPLQASVVSTTVLLLMLKAKRQHYMLLRKMLPKKVIRKLHRHGGMFVESFDNVTVLFSDIVSYTSMAATMEPITVVNMLNTVYRWVAGGGLRRSGALR